MIINSILLNRIKTLSETEPNNLTRRCAKFSEELGELSAACLAVDDPDGKNYKDLGPQHVKEESVDCLLMAFSTFFDPTIGGTIEELVQLLSKKCDKWENTSHKGVGLNHQTLKTLNDQVVNSRYTDEQITKAQIDQIHEAKTQPEVRTYVLLLRGSVSQTSIIACLNSNGYTQVKDEGGGACDVALFVDVVSKTYYFWYQYHLSFRGDRTFTGSNIRCHTIHSILDLEDKIKQHKVQLEVKVAPVCSASEWYDIYFSGISRKQLTEYLASCGFIDIYPSPPKASIPILSINPTRRLYKFYYIDLHEFEVNDYSHIITAGTINDLSNFINVAINKVN